MSPDLPFQQIETILTETCGDPDLFAQELQRQRIPHISFSQIVTVEACPYRYYLQYVLSLEPDPVPDYFVKGKILHKVIAASYETLSKQKIPDANEYKKLISIDCSGDMQRHLFNAVTVHLNHIWEDCEVMAVEQPFILKIDAALPPVVGVIDLILRQGDRYLLVDHKTGRDFYPQDALQMAIYREYIQSRFGDVPCYFYYDHYRWVNDLSRIRKPPFQRIEVTHSARLREAALERMRCGWLAIKQVREQNGGVRNGECFRCPYKPLCRQRDRTPIKPSQPDRL